MTGCLRRKQAREFVKHSHRRVFFSLESSREREKFACVKGDYFVKRSGHVLGWMECIHLDLLTPHAPSDGT